MTRVPAKLRRIVRERAGGRCEYCLAPERLSFQTHQMEHIVAEKHEGATIAENLALACIGCNQCKGADLSSLDPLTGTLTALFHPRRDRWRDHFELRGLFPAKDGDGSGDCAFAAIQCAGADHRARVVCGRRGIGGTWVGSAMGSR